MLYRVGTSPEAPHEDEGITRDPIGIIVEDTEYYISPFARLDCGRIYTVEDNLKVAKVGRVHQDSLDLLKEYYRDLMS